MTLHPTELRERLQAAINEADFDASELARRIGRSAEYIRDFLNGRKNSIKANELVAIETELKTEPGHLTGFGVEFPPEALKPILRGYKGKPPAPASQSEAGKIMTAGQVRLGQDYLPIYPTSEYVGGGLKVLTFPFDFVPRPWFLKEARESYGVIIAGERFSPAYDPGDIAVVNPLLPIVRNRNVIVTKLGEPGTFDAQIGRLLRWDDDGWVLRMFDGDPEQTFSRGQWSNALRLVARVEMT